MASNLSKRLDRLEKAIGALKDRNRPCFFADSPEHAAEILKAHPTARIARWLTEEEADQREAARKRYLQEIPADPRPTLSEELATEREADH
jgi:hypothetical protein